MLKEKVSATIPIAGLFAAVSALCLAVIAGLGTRFEIWHFSLGLGLLKISVYAACLAAFTSAGGLLCSLLMRNRAGFTLAVAACVLSGILIGIPAYWIIKARQLPAIHDISTDTLNPPRFEVILSLRRSASNPPDYGGPQIAAQQKAAYPDIAPVVLQGQCREVFNRSFITAKKMGWNIVAADQGKGIIEAVDSTLWFGFKDDVVIRLACNDGSARVDVRSVSRVGVSDIGTNALRIRKFLHDLMGRQTGG